MPSREFKPLSLERDTELAIHCTGGVLSKKEAASSADATASLLRNRGWAAYAGSWDTSGNDGLDE